jgi:hypothetical protein
MEDLKKSVLIKGDNIIGFTGRGVIPMTQEEFNALPTEKQLNGSYYITDGTDEIVISDNEVSEKQLWSSQKIATELKTSSNTEPITITFPNIVEQTSYGNASQYQIRNGICYVTMDIMPNGDSENTVVCELPMPTMITNISFVPVALDQYRQNGMFILSTNGILKTYGLKNGIRYATSFSYPIA